MRKPNSGDFIWNDAAITTLKSLWLDGMTGGEIGRRLGLSRSAVMGKLRRLDMLCRDRRPQPIMPLMPGMRTNKRRPPKTPDRFFAEFAAKPPPPPPPPEPPIGSFDLLELRHGHCRWPSSGDGPRWTFCGAKQTRDSSYCAEHHAMAHNRGSQRDYDRAAEQALAGKLFASRAGVME